MKLDHNMLKRLVLEEIKKSSLNEMPGPRRRNKDPFVDEFVGLLETAIMEIATEQFSAVYDPGDPSMDAAGGEAAWAVQVEEAVVALLDELRPELESTSAHVVAALIGGEYYRDR